MSFPWRISTACTLAIVAFSSSSSAHNLFVLVEVQPSGPGAVDVIFEHSPYPGPGVYNQPLLDRGKTWIETLDGQAKVALNPQEITRLGKKFLQTKTTTPAPRAIVHSCDWGVYKGRLDYFHGKYLDVKTADQANRLGRTKSLPLDIVPVATADSLKLQVLYQGEPQPGATVWIWSPDGKETARKTNDAGQLAVTNLMPGLYSFATIHVLDSGLGEFLGESYKDTMHGTTLSLPWPLK